MESINYITKEQMETWLTEGYVWELENNYTNDDDNQLFIFNYNRVVSQYKELITTSIIMKLFHENTGKKIFKNNISDIYYRYFFINFFNDIPTRILTLKEIKLKMDIEEEIEKIIFFK